MGGDGITYIAYDLERGKPVRVREFFPDALARRRINAVEPISGFNLAFSASLDSFRALWSKLEQMRGLSGLHPVLSVFEENNTVYAILEAIDGSTLREYLLLSSVTGSLDADQAQRLLAPILPALSALHSTGTLHLGISPSSVIVTSEKKAFLTGFSVWQARTAGGGLRSELYPGYAAPEQYTLSERQGPWTDIYAVAGLYYRVLVGSDPIEASLRVRNDRLMIPGKLAESIPAYVVNALTNALEIDSQKRTESVEIFKAELNAAPDAVWAGVETAPPEEVPAETPVNKNETRRIIFKTAGMTLIFCILAGIVLMLTLGKDIFFKPHGNTDPQILQTTTLPLSGNYEVPDFVSISRSYSDIISNAVWSQQFTFDAKNDYSADVPEGYIIAQDPPSGRVVPQGTPILLTVSLGVEKIVVREYVGYLLSDIQPILEEDGFVVSVIEERNNGEKLEGVIGTGSLTEGERYPRGTTIFLHVYGPAPTEPEEPSDDTTEDTDVYDDIPTDDTTSANDSPWWLPW